MDACAGNSARSASLPDTRISSALGKLSDLIAKADGLGNYARTIADRALGEEPQSPSATGATPARCGAIGSLEDKLDFLNRELSDLSEQLDRIGTAV